MSPEQPPPPPPRRKPPGPPPAPPPKPAAPPPGPPRAAGPPPSPPPKPVAPPPAVPKPPLAAPEPAPPPRRAVAGPPAGPSGPPAGPGGPAPGIGAAAQDEGSPWTKRILIGIAALLLVGAGAGGAYFLTHQNKEVLLEARATPGPKPFTPPLGPPPSDTQVAQALGQPAAATGGGATSGGNKGGGASSGPPPGRPGGPSPGKPGGAPASSPAGGGGGGGAGQGGTVATPPPGSGGGSSGGGAAAVAVVPVAIPVALSTPVASACDRDQLGAALALDATKAQAWRNVLNVKAADQGPYIGSLVPAILSQDTRVTNSGYDNGQVVARQSVLQKGTAVLMDPTGVPVVRCESGTPLLPPLAVSGTPDYTGTRWPGFDPGQVVASTTPPQTIASPRAAGASPSTVPAGGGANLVVDGGFEGGLVAPWGTGQYEPRSSIFWGTAQATATVVGGISHSGAHALVISNFSPQAPNVYRTLSQKVTVSPGAKYCLSFWEQTSSALAGVASFPLDKAWVKRVVVPAGSSGWVQYAGTLTAEGPTLDVRIISENKGQVAVDDIELTAGACKVADGQVLAGKSAR